MSISVGSVNGALAQGTRVNVDAGVSHARPPADVDVEPGSYALLGARFASGPAFGSVYGALATDADVADWIGGRLGARLETPGGGAVNWALTGIASAFRLGDPTPYEAATVRLIPEARLVAGSAAIVLRGYGGLGRSDVSDASTMPPASVVSDLWVYGAGLEVSRLVGSTQVWAGLESYNAAGGSYSAGYAGLASPAAGGVLRLGLQLWDTPGDPQLAVNLSLSLPIGGRWSAELAVGRSGPDPLLGSPAAVDGSLLVSWTAYAPRLEPVSVVTLSDREPGTAVFRLDYDGAEAVSVIGSFSGWEPVPMNRRDDVWVAVVAVEPGLYHFGFLVDGEWYVPTDAPGLVTDEFGRSNATLVVPDR